MVFNVQMLNTKKKTSRGSEVCYIRHTSGVFFAQNDSDNTADWITVPITNLSVLFHE